MINRWKYCEQIIKHENYKNLELYLIVNYIRKILWVSELEVEDCITEIIEEINNKINNSDSVLQKKISNILKTRHVPKDIWEDIWFLKAKDFRNFKSILSYLIQWEGKVPEEKVLYYTKNIKSSTWLNIHETWRSYLYNVVPISKKKRIRKYDECVIFDIEFDMQNGREQIIEIAAVKIKNNRVIGKFNRLIKNNFKLSKKFIEITNIKSYNLKYKDSDTTVLKEFFNFIKDTKVLVGFAISHNDIPMLKRFDIVKKINNFNLHNFDILDLQSYLAVTKNEQKSLSYYLESLNINEEDVTLHRALEDVSIMYELFLNIDFREVVIKKTEL